MYYDDVETGAQIPEIVLELTVTRLVMLASATRDFYAVHHDRDYARANNAPDMFMNTPAYAGIFNRLIAAWAGPESKLKKLGFQMKNMNFPGDKILGSGKVSRKYTNGKDCLVDLELTLANQRGVTTVATATVLLLQKA